MIKVYMGQPSTGNVVDFQAYMLRQIEEKYTDQVKLVYPRVCAHRIFHDHARNMIVEDFLASDCDVLWFLDSDISPPVHVLDLITKHYDEWKVAGAPYPIFMKPKGEERQQIIFTVYNGTDGKGLAPSAVPDEGVEMVDGLATGCMFIKREVFSLLEKPYFEFKYDPITRNPIEGEDLGFCMKLGKLGIKFLTDYSMVCKHYKEICLLDLNNYAIDYAKKTLEQYEAAIQPAVQQMMRDAYRAGKEAGQRAPLHGPRVTESGLILTR